MKKRNVKKLLFLLINLFLLTNVYSQHFVYDWVKSAGGERWDLANDIVIDNEKNVYMTGGFEQTAFFGTDSLVSAGKRDIFIAKYDSLGNLIWLKRAGGKKYDNPLNLTIDKNNNLLLAGNFQDTSTFEEHQLISHSYMNNFLAKYSLNGDLIATKSFNADTRASKLMITLSDNNDFFLSGTYYDTMSIDGDTIKSFGKTGIFIAKFNSEFDCKSLINISGYNKTDIKAIKYFNKRFYILTEFTDSIDINTDRYWSYGSSDLLLLKVDTAGNILNTKHFAGFGEDKGKSLIFGKDSSLYISAEFKSKLYFDNDSLISKGGKDLLLMKTDTLFNTIWYKQIGNTADEYANSLLINTANTVYLTGSFSDTLTTGNKTIVSKDGTVDMFIAKFSPDGENTGLKQSGGSGNEFNNKVINDPNNYLYIIGNFSYDFAFETDSISSDSIFSANNKDVFIARFYDCDYALYPQIGNDTSFCGYGTLHILNGSNGDGIFGDYKKYRWNTGHRGKYIAIYDSGYYSVTTIDSHKCKVTSDSVFVSVYPLPEPDLGDDINTTAGETIQLFGGYFESYLWSNDSVSQSITVNTSELPDYTNTFTLEVTNEYNCTAEDDINITVEGVNYSPEAPPQNQAQYEQTYYGNENNSADIFYNNSIITQIANSENKKPVYTDALVYPNPNKGEFFVNTDKIGENIKTLSVLCEDGRKIYEQANINSTQFKIKTKSKGVHYLLIETKTKLFFEKIIIQ